MELSTNKGMLKFVMVNPSQRGKGLGKAMLQLAFSEILARQVKYFKETEGGREIICQAFEDLAEKRVLDEKAGLIKNLMETMKWTAEQAMEAMKKNQSSSVVDFNFS